MPHDRKKAQPRAGAGAKPAEQAAHRQPRVWDATKDKLGLGRPEHILQLRDHLVTMMGKNREIGR